MRIETGPLQIGDDWPGVFIRGDNALMMYAPALMGLIAQTEAQGDVTSLIYLRALKNLLLTLESCDARSATPQIIIPQCITGRD